MRCGTDREMGREWKRFGIEDWACEKSRGEEVGKKGRGGDVG